MDKSQYLYKSPEESLYYYAKKVETPCLIYDFMQIEHTVKVIQSCFSNCTYLYYTCLCHGDKFHAELSTVTI
ncbi:hypothetical protein [Alkaliphilus crotonatoxidans]